MQSLMPILPIVSFFIKKDYERIGNHPQLCDLLHDVFVDNYKPQLTFFKARHYQFDLKPFVDFLENKKFPVNDAAALYHTLFAAVENELSKNKTRPNLDAEELIKKFKTTIDREIKDWYEETNESILTDLTYHMVFIMRRCKYLHLREDMRRQCSVKIKLEGNVMDTLLKSYKWDPTDFQCPRCTPLITSKQHAIESFVKLPKVLVIENELFNEQGDVDAPKSKVSMVINPFKLLKEYHTLVQKNKCLYRLVSFVTFKGKNREDGTFVSYSIRQDTHPRKKNV
jgi:hypothetical protein